VKKRSIKYIRQDWVLNWIKTHGPTNVLDIDFVDSFIEEFGVKYRVQIVGAHTCPMIGSLLSHMYKCNLLDRGIIGLSESRGYPKWVYVYTEKNWKPE